MTPVREVFETEIQGKKSFTVFIAFFAIYVLWGSTFLAIRIAVATVPPFFAAGIRFFLAGMALYIWGRFRGSPAPSRLQWRNLFVISILMFFLAYSALFWAEKTVPSGVASVLVAGIPIWTTLLEIFVLKQQRFHPALGIALVIGFCGVSLLVFNGGAGNIDFLACLAILGSGVSWSVGTILSKMVALPESKVITAGAEMTGGGASLLLLSVFAGELHPFPALTSAAVLAILYLIVAGSILAFTAYVWLLGRLPATKVASYAYVNPVVALFIGHWLGGETFGWRTLAGATLIVGSVLLLLGTKIAFTGVKEFVPVISLPY